jgi:ferredoxin
MDSTQPLLDPQKPSGPVVIRKLKTWVDRDLCIGAATCIAIAPKTFVLDSEAKAIYLATSPEDSDETIIDAAKGCPVAAIIIEDENGNRIFPK